MLQQCENLAWLRFVYYPPVCCPYFGGGDLAWRQVSGSWRIGTFTIVHRCQHSSFSTEAPFYFAAL
jgi:uncharacterized OB-fold protein